MRKLKFITNRIVPFVFGGIILVSWECILKWKAVPTWILPGPIQIIRTFFETLSLMAKHVQSTLIECLVGFIAAIVLAFIIAFLMNEIPLIKSALYPLLVASQTVPIISVAPLFIIWFGYGILPKIIVVVLVCFFPIAISLMGGLAEVGNEYLDLFKSMQASRIDIFRMVKPPLALPAFFSGLKISAAYSVMGAVIGEWLGAKEGLGTYMTLSQRSFKVDRVFAAILLIMLLSMALFAVVAFTERLIIPWNRRS